MSAATALAPTAHTLEEYLALEEEAFRSGSDAKYEYIGGQIIAMAGAQPEHIDIVSNAHFALRQALRPHGCRVSTSDQRVELGRSYVYPDIVVTCEERRFGADNPPSLLNPTLIVEVLSSSTKGKGFSDKLSAYVGIDSLQEYWIVATGSAQVWQYVRQARGWLLLAHVGMGATLTSECLDLALPLATLYEGIAFGDEHANAPSGDGADTANP